MTATVGEWSCSHPPSSEGGPMFDHHCTACDQRQLIFPSQVTR